MSNKKRSSSKVEGPVEVPREHQQAVAPKGGDKATVVVDEKEPPKQEEAQKVPLEQLDDLMLRSLLLEVQMWRNKYAAEREAMMRQFDQQPAIADLRTRVQKADGMFGEELVRIHQKYGTTQQSHVYNMDEKSLVPRPPDQQQQGG